MLVAADGQDQDHARVLQHALRQPERVEEQVHRHQPELVGDHQRRQDEEEQRSRDREAEPREGVAGELPRTRFVIVTTTAMIALLRNSRGSGGSSSVEGVLPGRRA